MFITSLVGCQRMNGFIFESLPFDRHHSVPLGGLAAFLGGYLVLNWGSDLLFVPLIKKLEQVGPIISSSTHD